MRLKVHCRERRSKKERNPKSPIGTCTKKPCAASDLSHHGEVPHGLPLNDRALSQHNTPPWKHQALSLVYTNSCLTFTTTLTHFKYANDKLTEQQSFRCTGVGPTTASRLKPETCVVLKLWPAHPHDTQMV